MALLLVPPGAVAGPSVSTTASEIVVDGVLDEVAWSAAEPATGFTRFQPVEGGEAPGTTEVRFVQDDKHLYVGIRVRGSGYPIRARITPREDINQDDQVGVYLDTYRDGRTGYIFYFNPLGIQQDIRHNNGSWSTSWDTAFRSRGRVVDGDGYDIEVAFPWRALRYPGTEGPQDWGLILTRKIPREGAKYGYPALERNHPRLFTQAATLTNVRPADRGSALELVPGVTAVQTWPRAGLPPRDRFTGVDSVDRVLRPSLDARYGITPDIGLTATLNPDFSQVEADQFDVRLDPRFAFQFDERRPFFLDGIEFFQDRMDTLYTRSIAEPLTGLKVGGRQGPVSIGILNALDRSPLPSFHERGTAGFSAAAIGDRWAENSLVRVRGDAFGSGYLGLTVADKRIIGADGARPRGQFDAAGADVAVPLGDRWLVQASSLHSVWGADTGRLRWGTDTEAAITRAPGLGWGTELAGRHVTPDHRNEMGFLNQSGLTTGVAAIDYTFEPDGPIDTYTPGLGTEHTYELEGDFTRTLDTSQEVVIGGIHTASLLAGVSQWRQGRIPDDPAPLEIAGARGTAMYTGQFGRALIVSPAASVARVLDFTAMAPAHTAGTEGTVSLRPTVSTLFELTGSAERRTVLAGRDRVTSWAGRARVNGNLQFTRELGLRVVEEYATRGDGASWLNSVLLTWLTVPGTAAYLGYTEISDLEPREPLERIVFAKASVLLRP